MALTWEFYLALVLVFSAIAIVIIFLYLLFNPQRDLFDSLKGLFKRKSKGGIVSSGQIAQRMPMGSQVGQVGQVQGVPQQPQKFV